VPTASTPRWTLFLRPRWILSHLFVVLLVVVMINLGFWQLRRLDEKRDLNALVEGRQEAAAVPVESLLAPGDAAGGNGAAGHDTADAVDAVRYRAVTVTGRYDDDATVPVRNRTQDGLPGVWLLTPVELDDGTRVAVIRGFVGFDPSGEPYAAAVPEGEVTVHGFVMRSRSFDGTAPRDIDPVLEEPDTLPAVVVAEESDPAEPTLDERIVTIDPPELGEGPHLSYAIQWFIFSAIGIVGYPVVLRKVLQRRGKEVDDDPAGDDPGDGDEPPGGGGAGDLDAELEEILRRS
jgi:surfeit locus 1 family protein